MPFDQDRRRFLKLSSATAIAGFCGTTSSPALDTANLYRQVIPSRKDLDPAWIRSLVKRGSDKDAAIHSSDPRELSRIGMTVGGIGCGTVYLSGDGQLYVWDIFHRPHEGVVAQRFKDIPEGLDVLGGHRKIVRERDGANYIKPPSPETFPNPFRQEFELHVDGDPSSRKMNRHDWKQVRFNGRWPTATIEYHDPGCPLDARLEAWTPFIPLQVRDSSLPVTVMEFTLSNQGNQPVNGSFTGFWENPVLIHSRRKLDQSIVSSVSEPPAATVLHHQAGENSLADAADWGSAALATVGKSEPTADGGGLCHRFKLAPGESRTFRYLLTWHFPNIPLLHQTIGPQQAHYATRFKDASEVATHLINRFDELRSSTMRWVETWNDSTLPQWLLDRSILTTNTLQTTTCEILAGKDYPDGRFWAWEGIGCCPGTCAHVWHYAQGVARLFPELERNLREITDYDIGYHTDGSINFRGDSNKQVAIDAQTGIILRTWREHLMSPDQAFLKRVWPRAKQALQWLIHFDGSDKDGLDGLLDGEQHNTLDAEWYGKVHCLCSLYLAALRAGEEMARVMDDLSFAGHCQSIFKKGSKKIATLFDGEFYVQQEDAAHLDKIGVGKGCYIDQVIGQWWASQVGLGTTQDRQHVHAALNSLWRYNFVPHVGTFREAFNRGRFYALNDDAGLIMCSWPKGGLRDDFKKHWQYGYFNECMSGFEWQVAAHMIQEGEPINDLESIEAASLIEDSDDPRSLTLRGLAIGRSIHDRYHPSKRNPYNEIECSDHYARANASYSAFLAACGFSHDGPSGKIGFSPKIQATHFKAPFTTASGWGTFTQQQVYGQWNASIKLVHGTLSLSEIRLPWLDGKKTQVHLNGQPQDPRLFPGGAGTNHGRWEMQAGDVIVLIG